MKNISRREFLDTTVKTAATALTAKALDEMVNPKPAEAGGSGHSSKSGVADQVLSLPKGGGAIKGLGEKFQPDLHTGTGNFSIPIQAPPGRSGFQPELSLQYSTGAANGPFGLGWDIGIPNVSRQTAKGVPVYDDDQDTFILSGAEDLVPVEGNRYQPRTEGLFARIRHIKENGKDYWEVTSKKNIRSYYGWDDSSKVFVEENGRKKIFKWLLSRTEDPCGNIMRYYYQKDAKPEHYSNDDLKRSEEPHQYHQVYLTEISYMNFREQHDTEDQYFIHIHFDYGQFNDDGSLKTGTDARDWDFRPDRFSSYRSGFEIRTTRRVKRILIKVRDEMQREVYHLVKAYELKYKTFDPDKDFSNLSLLTSVTLRGFRHGETKAFPPLTLGYTDFWPQDRVFENFSAPAGALPDKPLNDPNYELIDLTGNGLPDVIHTGSNGMRYWKNVGECQFIGPIPMRHAPAGVMLQQSGVQFADMQGNGRADLLVTGGTTAGYYETTFDDQNQWERFHAYLRAPEFSFEDPDVRLVDMDGDGVIDVLRTDERAFMYFRNLEDQGFENPRPIPRFHDAEQFPDIYFSDPRVHLADMNGDGLQDIVFVHNRRIEYWSNQGHGRWGGQILMADAPDLTDPNMPNGNYDPRRLHFNDVDGDGLADLIYVGYDCAKIWLNQSGNGWSRPLIIRGTPLASGAAVRIADMKGSGTAGILWTFEPSVFRGSHYKYLDLNAGIKPYLLSVIENNLGAATIVQYRSSADFWIEDYKKGDYWLTHLPFPVQVVAKVEVIDHIAKSKLSTLYSYHHGYYDGREREYRGFGRVEQMDAEEFSGYATDLLVESKTGKRLLSEPSPADLVDILKKVDSVPPILTKTWFHPGIYIDEKTYMEKVRQEYFHGDVLAFTLQSYIEKNNAPHEAYRALRGSVLRTELYAKDGSDVHKNPYTVTENSYQVKQVRTGGRSRHGIYMSHGRESLTYHYERNPLDPRISHSMTVSVDEYGNVLASLAIAYSRRQPQYPEQAQYHVVLTKNEVINQTGIENAYFIGYSWQTRQIELKLAEGFFASPLTLNDIAALDLDNPAHNTFQFSRNYFDGSAYVGLPLQQIGSRGLVTRSETLAFKPGQIADVYGDKLNETDLTQAGYRKDEELLDHWWIQSNRVKYDEAQYCLTICQKDPIAPVDGSDERIYTTIFDRFSYLPIQTIDPIGNEIKADNDYLAMSPYLLTDINDNRTVVAFDALGFVKRTAVMGKVGENLGDLIDRDETATTYIHYDLNSYHNEHKPIWAHVWSREEHLHVNPAPRWLESRVYSDGFGREIQMKAKAAPGQVNGVHYDPRWVGSGWKIYNDKGWVIEQYEPFFSSTVEYEADKITGVSSHLFYDPLARVLRTDNPDGTFAKVVFDPWQQTTFDANDTVADSRWYQRMKNSENLYERKAAEKAFAHYNTPAVVHFDTLGRNFLSIQDNGSYGKYETRSAFDIQGNVLSMIDPRGNSAFRQVYDLSNNMIYRWQMDSGERYFFLNAINDPAKKWDSRHYLIESEYDIMNRPIELWVTLQSPDVAPVKRLAEKVEYGDSLVEAKANNYRGKIFRQYDGGGIEMFEKYDFKSNLLKKTRYIIEEFNYEADWSVVASKIHDVSFTYHYEYDAFNRTVAIFFPETFIQRSIYNESGMVESIRVIHKNFNEEKIIIENVEYNSRGQRTKIEYGNGVMAEYNYENRSARLKQLKSTSGEAIYLDYQYCYDPIGNVISIEDLSQQTIYFKNSVVTSCREYKYDPVYSLIEATGREHGGQIPHSDYSDIPQAQPIPHPNDEQSLRRYTEKYSYDAAANILQVKHIANGGSWTREYSYHEKNNRLKNTVIGKDPLTDWNYNFDEHGNHTEFSHVRRLQWDFKDQMAKLNFAEDRSASYLYTSGGLRCIKVIQKNSSMIQNIAINIGNFEMDEEFIGTTIDRSIYSYTIMDGKQRIAIVEEVKIFEGHECSSGPNIRFQLGDHLNSTVAEVDFSAALITYEEYYPFGGSAYRSQANRYPKNMKIYRYCSKQNDQESGFYCYEFRYYIPFLGRWICPDRIIQSNRSIETKEKNGYCFVLNNPINNVDQYGLESKDNKSFSNTIETIYPPVDLIDDSFQSVESLEIERYISNLQDKKENLVDSRTDLNRMMKEEWNKIAKNNSVRNKTKSFKKHTKSIRSALSRIEQKIKVIDDKINLLKSPMNVPLSRTATAVSIVTVPIQFSYNYMSSPIQSNFKGIDATAITLADMAYGGFFPLLSLGESTLIFAGGFAHSNIIDSSVLTICPSSYYKYAITAVVATANFMETGDTSSMENLFFNGSHGKHGYLIQSYSNFSYYLFFKIDWIINNIDKLAPTSALETGGYEF